MQRQIQKIKTKLKTPEYTRILILRTVGNFLILSSLFLIGKTFYLPVREEIRYFIDGKIQKQYIVAEKPSLVKIPSQPKGLLARALNLNEVEFLVPQDPNFSVVIPKIGANAKVLSNVDSSDEKIYLDALNKGVAHALGTKFPGEDGHIFLFAHSTDYFWNVGTYNAIFYLLNKLEKEDEIDLFYKGQRYVYKVINSSVADPSQVEYLTRKSNKEFLTLQTCWPPGTTLKRLLIFATRVVE
ncbi:sortase [Candidatus Roizmanbacteria bacterium]|nr:sortase [Candidatus Roizmanbacteria bacterium]